MDEISASSTYYFDNCGLNFELIAIETVINTNLIVRNLIEKGIVRALYLRNFGKFTEKMCVRPSGL